MDMPIDAERPLRHRPARLPQGRPGAAARRGALQRRSVPAGPGLRRDGAQPLRPRRPARRSTRPSALAMPGVLGIYTAADLAAAGIGPMQAAAGKHRDGSPPRSRPDGARQGRVRYVGDPVAIVVADTAAAGARRRGRGVPRHRAAARGDRRAARPQPGRAACCTRTRPATWRSTSTTATRRRWRGVRRRRARDHAAPCATAGSWWPRWSRAPPSALMEDGRCVLRVGCQGVFGLRDTIAGVLGVPHEQVRVLTGNVGGSFGMKAGVYPEYIAVLHAARAARAPGEVDGRALRQLPVRQPRPRPRLRRASWRWTRTASSSPCG